MYIVEYGQFTWDEDGRERLKDRREVKVKRHVFTDLKTALTLFFKQEDNPKNDFVRLTMDATQ